jgi:hypothetical protein
VKTSGELFEYNWRNLIEVADFGDYYHELVGALEEHAGMPENEAAEIEEWAMENTSPRSFSLIASPKGSKPISQAGFAAQPINEQEDSSMSRNRILQTATSPADPGDYMTEPDLHDHWLVGSVADYVSGDADREAGIEWLRARLESAGAASFGENGSLAVLPGGKEAYFREAHQLFAAARDKTLGLGLADFASPASGEPMRSMESAYCDKHGFYVSPDEFRTIPLDEFMRRAETGRRWLRGHADSAPARRARQAWRS